MCIVYKNVVVETTHLQEVPERCFMWSEKKETSCKSARDEDEDEEGAKGKVYVYRNGSLHTPSSLWNYHRKDVIFANVHLAC